MDTTDGSAITQGGAPAYNTSAWDTGGNGPQCSLSGEFCFFCRTNDEDKEPEFGEEDDVTAMKNLVRSLARQKKELPIIVTTIHNMYNKHIRPQVNFTHPITGINLSEPKWSKSSIQRHLTYSLEFPELFHGVIGQVFQSLITRQQETIIDPGTTFVVEDRRKALMDTVNTYLRWCVTQDKLYDYKKPPT